MNPFRYEGTFNTVFGKIVDAFVLNLLWILFCLPVITIGASTTALYGTADKVLRRSEGYLWQTFWKLFRENFGKSSFIWLLAVLIEGVLGADAWIMKYRYDQKLMEVNVTLGFLISMIAVALWFLFACAYTVKFDNSRKQILRNAFLLMFQKPLLTLETAVVFLVAGAGCYVVPILILVLPSLVMWYISYIMNQIYKGYLGEKNDE